MSNDEKSFLKDVYTLNEFCSMHNITRATFYNLFREGKAPTTIKLRKKILITKDSVRDWRKKMELKQNTQG